MTKQKSDDSILREQTGALLMIQGDQYLLLKLVFTLAFRNKSIRDYITMKCGETSEETIEKIHYILSPEDKPPSTMATCPHCNQSFELFILSEADVVVENEREDNDR